MSKHCNIELDKIDKNEYNNINYFVSNDGLGNLTAIIWLI